MAVILSSTRESPWKSWWDLNPEYVFLNHGSYGATPRAILEYQQQLRQEIESQPAKFYQRNFLHQHDHARRKLGEFIGVDDGDIALIPNATAGVNTILRNIQFKAGDEIVLTNHGYNSCNNAARYIADKSGAKVIAAKIPFPIEHSGIATETVLAAITPQTRLVMLDHVTSASGLILPIEEIIKELNDRNIETLIDGAHAPGMVPFHLNELGCTYYTGNCHKWLCTPKGAAFLYVKPSHQESIRPLSISHGANAPVQQRSRFRLEFDWLGTYDPTAQLCIPFALELFEQNIKGGMSAIMEHNHHLAIHAQRILCDALEVDLPCPSSMLGSLAAIPIDEEPLSGGLVFDKLQNILYENYNVEVLVCATPIAPTRSLRVSCQLYNHKSEYELLAEFLREIEREHNVKFGIGHN